MDKIYIVKADTYIFRVYSSREEAERYLNYIEINMKTGLRFLPTYLRPSFVNLQLLEVPISKEGDPLNLRLTAIVKRVEEENDESDFIEDGLYYHRLEEI